MTMINIKVIPDNRANLWVPETPEEHILKIRNMVMFENSRDGRLIQFVQSGIDYINNQFGTDIKLVGITDSNLILTNFGREFILPEAETRRVLIEKKKKYAL